MTMTEDRADVQAEPEAVHVPTLAKAKWVTVTDPALRRKMLLPEFPLEVRGRSVGEYRLNVPVGYGVVDFLQTGTDGGTYVNVNEQKLAPAAAGPTDEQLVVNLPEDLAALSPAELAASYAEYRARTERTIKHLHRHAEQRGMCDTFDNIMQRSGWPRRPRRWTVVLGADRTRSLSETEFLDNYVGRSATRKFSGLGKKIKVDEVIEVTATVEATEAPTKKSKVADLLSTEEVAELYAAHKDVDLDSVRVNRT